MYANDFFRTPVGRMVRVSLAGTVLTVVLGCAASITKVDGAVVAESEAIKVTVKDKRPELATLSAGIDTSWGVGKRIDEKLFTQPPLIGFAEALREVLDPALVGAREIELEVSQFDVAMTPSSGRGRGTDVMGSPAAQSQIAMSGGYGVAGALVVQGIANLIERAKAPNQLTLRVKAKLGERVASCEQDGLYVGEAQLADAWTGLLKATARLCAEPYLKKD